MAYRKRQSLNRLVFSEELIDRLTGQAEARHEAMDDKCELLIDGLRKLGDPQRQLLAVHLLTPEGILLDLNFTGSHWSNDNGQT